MFVMQRIDPMHVRTSAQLAADRARKQYGHALRGADAAVIRTAVDLALDHVFARDWMLVAPSDVWIPNAGGGSYRPGKWGEDEPWPAVTGWLPGANEALPAPSTAPE